MPEELDQGCQDANNEGRVDEDDESQLLDFLLEPCNRYARPTGRILG